MLSTQNKMSLCVRTTHHTGHNQYFIFCVIVMPQSYRCHGILVVTVSKSWIMVYLPQQSCRTIVGLILFIQLLVHERRENCYQAHLMVPSISLHSY